MTSVVYSLLATTSVKHIHKTSEEGRILNYRTNYMLVHNIIPVFTYVDIHTYL